MTVTCYDLGVPSRRATAEATVTINTYGNLHDPVFLNEPYSTAINKNTNTGTSIYRVTVDDADTQVLYTSRIYLECLLCSSVGCLLSVAFSEHLKKVVNLL